MGGRDKLLEDIDGVPLLRERAITCLNAAVDAVRVVLPPDRPERRQALSGLNVEIVVNEASGLGLSHSLSVGLHGLTADAALIVLADMPDLTTTHLDKIVAAAKAHPLAKALRGADQNGKPGHPVMIRKALFSEMAQLKGDTGAQPVLRRHKAATVLVPIGPAALRDLDTPEDWTEWRTRR